MKYYNFLLLINNNNKIGNIGILKVIEFIIIRKFNTIINFKDWLIYNYITKPLLNILLEPFNFT